LVALLKKYLCSDAPNLSRGPLNILDGAAGNGRVGAELRNQLANDPGIDCLVGTDLLPSARVATLRDRVPNPYDEYIVANLIEPSEEAAQQFKRTNFEVVLMCAALGPGDGDLPLEVVDAATRFLDVGGLLALTVNEKQQGPKGSRYSDFIADLGQGETPRWKDMVICERSVYPHRLDVKGKGIVYTAIIFRKMGS